MCRLIHVKTNNTPYETRNMIFWNTSSWIGLVGAVISGNCIAIAINAIHPCLMGISAIRPIVCLPNLILAKSRPSTTAQAKSMRILLRDNFI
jgi:hypothetical protein